MGTGRSGGTTMYGGMISRFLSPRLITAASASQSTSVTISPLGRCRTVPPMYSGSAACRYICKADSSHSGRTSTASCSKALTTAARAAGACFFDLATVYPSISRECPLVCTAESPPVPSVFANCSFDTYQILLMRSLVSLTFAIRAIRPPPESSHFSSSPRLLTSVQKRAW